MAQRSIKSKLTKTAEPDLAETVAGLERRVAALETVLRSFGKTVAMAPMFDGGGEAGGGGSDGGSDGGDGGGSDGGGEGDGGGGDGGGGDGGGGDVRRPPKRSKGRVTRR